MATIDLSTGIDSLTNFKRDTAKYLKRLRLSGGPLVLTVNGKAEVVVQDAAAYQRIQELVDRAETILAIDESLAQYAKGRGKPAIASLKKLRKRLKVDDE